MSSYLVLALLAFCFILHSRLVVDDVVFGAVEVAEVLVTLLLLLSCLCRSLTLPLQCLQCLRF
jgi:hypothetical protein